MSSSLPRVIAQTNIPAGSPVTAAGIIGEPAIGLAARYCPAGTDVPLEAIAVIDSLSDAMVIALRAGSIGGGDAPRTRVHLLGDSLTMRSFRALTGNTYVEQNATDIAIELGSGAALPPPGSSVRVINQSDPALNLEPMVIGATGTSTIVRFPLDISGGKLGASIKGAIYGIRNNTGWWEYAEGELAALGKPCEVIRNGGDGGDTLVQMRARIASEIAPGVQPGDVVIVMGGINGAGTAAADDALDESIEADVIAQLGGIIDDLLALGVVVCASTITQAQAAGYWTTASIALSNTKAANGYLRARALAESRLHVFDAHAALGGGDYAAADIDSVGVHFLTSAAEKVGHRFVSDCASLFNKAGYRRVLSAADAYVASAGSWNLLENPQFVGASGTTPPTGWTASLGGGTNTLTLSARADGAGNDLTIMKAATGQNGGTLTQDITARIAAGQQLAFGIEYESGALAEGHYWFCSLELDVGGVTYAYCIGNQQYTYGQGGRLPPGGVRRFFECYGGRNLGGREGCIVADGFTAARLVLRFQLGASGSMAMTVSRPQVYRVS